MVGQQRAPARQVRIRRLVRLVLGLCLAGVVYVLVQGLRNYGALLAAWGGFTPFGLALCAGGIPAVLLAMRRTPAGGWALRSGFALLTGWWIVYVLLLQPYHRFAVEVSLGIAAGCYGALLGYGPAVARRWPAPLRRRLDLLVFATMASLVGLEAGLKLLAALRPSPLLAVTGGAATARLRANSFLPGQERFGLPCNSAGFYDSEFAPKAERSGRMVAAIGDSFVAGIVPHERNFTTVAERRLDGVEIYNFGLPAIGPDQYLYLLEHAALPLQPDLVVVFLFAGNDLAEVATAAGSDRWLSLWLDRECVLLWQVPRRLLRIAGERVELPAPGRRPGQMPWLDDYRLEPGTFRESTYLRIARDRAAVACLPSPAREAALRRALAEMQRVAAPVPLAFVLIPAEFQVEDGLWAEVVDALGQPPALERDRFQRLVGEWLRTLDLPWLDLLPALRAAAAEPDGNRHLYHLRDTHWNCRGNEFAGRALADFLRSLLRR